MAQVINPDLKKDDSWDMILTGLQATSSLEDIKNSKIKKEGAAAKAGSQPEENYLDAMKRRLEAMRQGPTEYSPKYQEAME